MVLVGPLCYNVSLYRLVTMAKQFSEDFYGQVSQMMFNAKVQGELLGGKLLEGPMAEVDE